jgi:hypothetical protein
MIKVHKKLLPFTRNGKQSTVSFIDKESSRW